MLLADGPQPLPGATLVDNSETGKIVSYVKGHVPGLLMIGGVVTFLFGHRKAGLGVAGAGVAIEIWGKLKSRF